MIGVLGHQARGEIDMEVKGIGFLLQVEDALGERLGVIILVTTHAGVVTLCHGIDSQ